jgi:hypothetical protein
VKLDLKFFKHALAEGLPIIFACKLFDSFGQQKKKGKKHRLPPPETINPSLGYREYSFGQQKKKGEEKGRGIVPDAPLQQDLVVPRPMPTPGEASRQDKVVNKMNLCLPRD